MLALVTCLGLVAYVSGGVVVYTKLTPHTIEDEFRDMPASFGPEISDDGIRGLLVVGEPADGCEPLQPPPNNTEPNFTARWFVLIARYNCNFETKVRNAQLANYDLAIVHNVNSSDLETMSAKNAEDIIIPSVFVTDLAGVSLKLDYTYKSGFFIMVNNDLPFNVETHLLLPFAIVVVLCLVVILVFMIVKCIKDRRRARRHRLPNRSLKKIPTCKFNKGDPYETCAICLDDYQEGERLRVLPCAHAYHAKCIDPWLTQNRRVCPVCKRRVLAAGERRRAHSDSDSDDTEPLVADAPHNRTEGGTFEEQSENPFVRAARFMSRLRARAQPTSTEAPDTEEQEQEQANNDENENVENDTQPLIPEARSERERPRRQRRSQSQAPPAAPPPALLHSADHSINAESRGEIGVAALPAPASSVPHHLSL